MLSNMATTREALKFLAALPRVALNNIKPRIKQSAATSLKRKRGLGDRGQGRHGTLPRIGFEGGQNPFYLRVPQEPYYKDHSLRKEYVPISLLQLQRMIDLGRLDTSRPVDISSICNTRLFGINMDYRQYGFHITDEGADIFNAEICLEVQWIDELAIAALERCGSVITSRFYDPRALRAVSDPKKFFLAGRPIPVCKTPTTDVLEYYSSAKSRGYLADPESIRNAQYELSQKYGYTLPELSPKIKQLASQTKTKLQIFHGLQPGWIVNLPDKEIIKPKDPNLDRLYSTESMY